MWPVIRLQRPLLHLPTRARPIQAGTGLILAAMVRTATKTIPGRGRLLDLELTSQWYYCIGELNPIVEISIRVVNTHAPREQNNTEI
jgi:hypothetical protein